MSRVILLPEYSPGFGTGHCFRCLGLLLRLRSTTTLEVYIRIPRNFPVVALFPEAIPWILEPETFRESLDEFNTHDDLFIFDMPKIPGPFFEYLHPRGRIVAIDGGGLFRKKVPFLIDTLPNLYTDSNISSPWMLPLPRENRDPTRFRGRLRVLISLGGEDKKNLLLKLAQNKKLRSWLGPADVYVLPGPVSRVDLSLKAHGGSWSILPPVRNLAEQLGQYSLIITIFGLTAFEALASGTPILLVHPSRYHKKLATHAELASLEQSMRKTRQLIDALPGLRERAENFCLTRPDAHSHRELSVVISDLTQGSRVSCPGCSERTGRNIARSPQRTFFRCPKCGTEYQMLAIPQTISYSEEYFSTDYLKQYGKTYLEDFSSILVQGRRRLHIIEALSSLKGDALDIGCAYGPFMVAMKEAGYEPQGIDVSSSAVRYVRDTLHLKAQEKSIFSLSSEDFPPLTLVTLWYVIEHFSELEAVLRIIASLVVPGGILALGTPSSRGISRLRNQEHFFAESPLDHYSLWYPRQARKLLARHGFRVKKIVSPSFHPSRYPWPLRSPLLLGLTRFFHRTFLLGDTIEIYAVKRKTG